MDVRRHLVGDTSLKPRVPASEGETIAGMSVHSIYGERLAETPPVSLTGDRMVIHHLEITDPAVISAVHDWGRSHPEGPEAAYEQLPQHLSALLALGVRVASLSTSSAAAELVASAARNASESVSGTADLIRAELTATTEAFSVSLADHLDHLLSGDRSAVADTLRTTLAGEVSSMVSSLTSRIDAAVSASVATGLDGAVSRLHDGLTAVGASLEQVKDNMTAERARAAVVDKSAVLKGANFEDGVCVVLDELALACSAEFTPTGRTPGVSGHGSGDSLKGDGVWHSDGAVLVIETHDSMVRGSHSLGHKDGWSRYLTAAMKNRDAGAALGIVRNLDQNKGQLMRGFGSTMAVVVCDPTVPEDVLRLKFAVQVMELVARQQSASPSAPGLDLNVALRAVLELSEKAKTLDAIESLALKTSRSAQELHDRVAGLKVGMAGPLDRARETLEASMSSVRTTHITHNGE